MPDPLTSEISSPLQLRAELEVMVRRDPFGLAAGLDEEVAEPNVRGRCRRSDQAETVTLFLLRCRVMTATDNVVFHAASRIH